MPSDPRSLDQAILDTAVDGIVTIDETGIIHRVNPAVERLFGYRASELVGQNVNVLMPEPYHGEHDGYLARYRATGEARIIGIGREVAGQRKDGSRFPVHLSVGEWHDAANDERLFVGVLRDMRQLEDAERRVREREQRLEEVGRELDELTSLVSHDLRGSLHVIDGFAQVVVQDYQVVMDAEGTRLLGVLRRRIATMDEQIDCLIALARIARNELRYTLVDMEKLAEEVLATVLQQTAAEQAGRQIETQVESLPAVWADEELMREVFGSLIENAVKYTRDRTPARIEISGLAHRGECVYTVQDNGVGFDREYERKLFRLFQRVHRASEFEGTGAGLTLAERAVERHGGRIWAESEPGAGAAFHVALPYQRRIHDADGDG